MNISSAKKQKGIASFIVVLLIGMSLTVMTFGMVSTINGAQDSTNTVHAQTQSEIMAASGYQALATYFSTKTQSQLDSVTSGVISTTPSITYVKNTANCPASGIVSAPNYCFDVTATKSSVNAAISTSTVRALFNSVKTITTGNSSNSVFAGGLTIAGSARFTGDSSNPINVELLGGTVGVVGGATTIDGVTFIEYNPRSFIKAADLRAYANYIFYLNSSSDATMCKNNMNGVVVEGSCTTTMPSYVSYSGGTWNITASAVPAGVLWFNGNAALTLAVHIADYTNSLANTILVTGDMRVDDAGSGRTSDVYSASFFNSAIPSPGTISAANKTLKLCSSTAANRPDQYCDSTGALKDTSSFPAALANVLFLVDGMLDLNNSANSTFNLNGNVISNTLRGGTGSASGDVKGNGNFNIVGNITVTGGSLTTIQGSVSFDLSRASSSQNFVPTISYTNLLKNIKYQ